MRVRQMAVPFDDPRFVFEYDREGQTPPWVEGTVEALIRLLTLPDGWDSYGARSVDPACVKTAIEIALDIMHDRTPRPTIVPTSSGGVQLEWHTRGIDLEIEIRSPFRISASFEDQRNNTVWVAEQVNGFKPLRDALREMARRQS